jgi:hypothetical protein
VEFNQQTLEFIGAHLNIEILLDPSLSHFGDFATECVVPLGMDRNLDSILSDLIE